MTDTGFRFNQGLPALKGEKQTLVCETERASMPAVNLERQVFERVIRKNDDRLNLLNW